MIPTTASRRTLTDYRTAVGLVGSANPGDVAASILTYVVIAGAAAIGGGPWWLAAALLTVTTFSLGRLYWHAVTSHRDARDFLSYLDTLPWEQDEDGPHLSLVPDEPEAHL